MFYLPDSWVWDFWTADDGEQYHLFFLYASRALHDPEARHYRASVGHAVSTDLVHWTRVADALVRSDAPAWDDLATWTGSVVRHPDGQWVMFYTGSTRAGDSNIQRIGYATSPDLITWTKSAANPVLQADPQWYETLDDQQWHDEAFRDPWVFADPDSQGWHMLITARGRTGPANQRGVIGHAWSPDLTTWELRPPLTEPGLGFGQLEVLQVAQVDGTAVVLFSCMAEHLNDANRPDGQRGGVWAAPAASLTGPFDIAGAYPLTDRSLYSGRLVSTRDGGTALLAFHHDDANGEFVGTISDPMPVRWESGKLQVVAPNQA